MELMKCIVGQKPEKREVHLHLKDSVDVHNILRKLTHLDRDEAPKVSMEDKKTLSSLLASTKSV